MRQFEQNFCPGTEYFTFNFKKTFKQRVGKARINNCIVTGVCGCTVNRPQILNLPTLWLRFILVFEVNIFNMVVSIMTKHVYIVSSLPEDIKMDMENSIEVFTCWKRQMACSTFFPLGNNLCKIMNFRLFENSLITLPWLMVCNNCFSEESDDILASH